MLLTQVAVGCAFVWRLRLALPQKAVAADTPAAAAAAAADDDDVVLVVVVVVAAAAAVVVVVAAAAEEESRVFAAAEPCAAPYVFDTPLPLSLLCVKSVLWSLALGSLCTCKFIDFGCKCAFALRLSGSNLRWLQYTQPYQPDNEQHGRPTRLQQILQCLRIHLLTHVPKEHAIRGGAMLGRDVALTNSDL